jgi:hypothetical protein
MRSTRPASAKAKGPGAAGSGGGTTRSTAPSGTATHGFSSRARQQSMTSRPPGFSARRRLAKAAAGSAKNMTPKRETSRSTDCP